MATPLPTLRELGPCTFGKPQKPQGYATKQYKGRQIAAHRAAWLEAGKEIPEGMMLDHVCHSVAAREEMCHGGPKCIHRSCYNIDHLRLVTHAENQEAGSRKLRNRRTCTNGHPTTDENIGQRTNIVRGEIYEHEYCLPCSRESSKKAQARYRAKKKGLVS